jgi:hypothetical protein
MFSRILVTMAALILSTERAAGDAVIPVVDINPPGLSVTIGGSVFTPTTSVVEGGIAHVFILLTNPSTTGSLVVNSLNISIPSSGRRPDLTDQLTTAGASLFVNSCAPLNVPGILAGGPVSIPAGTSCLDVVDLNTLPLTQPDEGQPDSGTTEVDVVAIAPNGNSLVQSVDIQVDDVPEPSGLLLVGSGLLALFWFANRRVRESSKTNSKTFANAAEQKRRHQIGVCTIDSLGPAAGNRPRASGHQPKRALPFAPNASRRQDQKAPPLNHLRSG